MAILKNTTIDTTGFLKLPTGTGGQRPGSPANGSLRFNTDRAEPEIYSTEWKKTQRVYEDLVRDAIQLELDALNPQSYPGSGTTWFDTSGSNRNATINGATFVNDVIPHFSFDGSNDYISASLGNNSGDYAHTIEIAIRSDIHQRQYTARRDPIQIGNTNSTSRYSSVDINSNGTINWYFYSNDAVVENVYINPLEWTILTLTYSGGGSINNRKLYLNGSKIPWRLTTNASANLNLDTNATVNIGRDGPRDQAYWGGDVAFVRVHSRALTEEEVDQNYTVYAEQLGLRTLGTRKNPAKSGFDIAENYPDLPTGYFWIRNEKMPNSLQMYVDMVEDGGGFDFYPIQNGTSIWVAVEDNSGTNSPPHSGVALGLDIIYPRSKYHWRAASNFVRVALRQSESEYDRYFRTCYAVFRSNSTTSGSGDGGNYTSQIMRDGRAYGSGAADWRVPDGGRWWLRDSTFTEPNGDYLNYGFLNINGRRVTWNTGGGGGIGGYDFPFPYALTDLGFNDIASDRHHATDGFYLVSTNRKP